MTTHALRSLSAIGILFAILYIGANWFFGVALTHEDGWRALGADEAANRFSAVREDVFGKDFPAYTGYDGWVRDRNGRWYGYLRIRMSALEFEKGLSSWRQMAQVRPARFFFVSLRNDPPYEGMKYPSSPWYNL